MLLSRRREVRSRSCRHQSQLHLCFRLPEQWESVAHKGEGEGVGVVGAASPVLPTVPPGGNLSTCDRSSRSLAGRRAPAH